ncbi:hypothetical protein A2U01_0088308 [Trifolium medium]|uniref:Uncharacterized protein n=1 Tax=Trifolium medium TaxID=97028 RepID=A0A392U3G8_9FABA|nr:hypothetical protein [Trifolium medium]
MPTSHSLSGQTWPTLRFAESSSIQAARLTLCTPALSRPYNSPSAT